MLRFYAKPEHGEVTDHMDMVERANGRPVKDIDVERLLDAVPTLRGVVLDLPSAKGGRSAGLHDIPPEVLRDAAVELPRLLHPV